MAKIPLNIKSQVLRKVGTSVGKKVVGTVKKARASYKKAWGVWSKSPAHAKKVSRIRKGHI